MGSPRRRLDRRRSRRNLRTLAPRRLTAVRLASFDEGALIERRRGISRAFLWANDPRLLRVLSGNDPRLSRMPILDLVR